MEGSSRLLPAGCPGQGETIGLERPGSGDGVGGGVDDDDDGDGDGVDDDDDGDGGGDGSAAFWLYQLQVFWISPLLMSLKQILQCSVRKFPQNKKRKQ